MLAGLVGAGLMALAALRPAWLAVDAAAWSRLFFGQFVLATAAPVFYVALTSWSTAKFQLQALVDALFGLLVYLVMFTGVMVALVTLKWLTPWLGCWPGMFLLWYGFRLRRGKQFPMLELR